MSKISKVGVIGAGNMGSGIAQKIAQEGIPVIMMDIKDAFVDRGLNNIKSLLQKGVERGVFEPGKVDDILSRIKGTTVIQDVADADIVIEAVFEDKQVKHDLFQRLDATCDAKTILATNTSSFYVREFAEKTGRPDRFIGLHYFYHPAMNRLLEVIPHATTTQETVEQALLFAKLHGKDAILVKDAPGFAVNRFFVPFLNEATRMLEENVANIPTIEAAAKSVFRIGMGPFELMNVTGIPIAIHSSTTLGNELGPFYATSECLKAQGEAGKPWDLSGEVDESKAAEIGDRFLGVCLGVAAALVDEGVATIEDTDRGAKIGLRWSLGPFEIMNRIGIDKTYEVVQAIVSRYPDFRMPRILKKQKDLGQPFAFQFVDLKIKDGIATITINRPEAMNALNKTVVAQLDQRFTEAENNPEAKAIVFQGAGKAFVAGADIRYFVKNIKNNRIQDTVSFTRKGHELLLRIEKCAKPTIALLDGLSLGGGSELALACQKILATPEGSMGFPETSIAIYPGLGGMLRLARHVGPELAKYYVFTGAPIKARDALELGVITKVVDRADVPEAIKAMAAEGKTEKYAKREIPSRFQPLAEACSGENLERLLNGQPPTGIPDDLAQKITRIMSKKAPVAVRLANELIDQQNTMSIEEGIEAELGRLEEIFSTADALEGLSSVGKRAPAFKGA